MVILWQFALCFLSCENFGIFCWFHVSWRSLEFKIKIGEQNTKAIRSASVYPKRLKSVVVCWPNWSLVDPRVFFCDRTFKSTTAFTSFGKAILCFVKVSGRFNIASIRMAEIESLRKTHYFTFSCRRSHFERNFLADWSFSCWCFRQNYRFTSSDLFMVALSK